MTTEAPGPKFPQSPNPPEAPKKRRWRRVVAVLGGLLLLVVVAGAVFAWQIWSDIEKVDFDPEASRGLLSEKRPSIENDFFQRDAPAAFDDIDTTTTTLELTLSEISDHTLVSPAEVESEVANTDNTTGGLPPPPTSAGRADLTGYLIAGSDGSPSVGNADVIYLAIKGSGTVLYTVPRSLYLPNPCTGEPVRAALLLRGCPGVASGPSLLALGLSEFTGVDVAGFAVVGYSGFPQIVDALGGIEICSDTPRGQGKKIIIPAGCNLMGGSAAAWWVTSRSQDEFVDGEWRAVAGDDAMSRSARQSVALGAVISRVLSYGSPGSLVGVAQQVPNTFALGGMSIGEAAGLAMSARGGYNIASFPTQGRTTPDGVYVLYPTEPFSQTLARNGQ